jgi:hypothetical protein
MYITIKVTIAARAAITKLNRKFVADRIGMRVKSGKSINDVGIATAKAIKETNTIKAIYALNAINTPPFLS